jgi:hypothetical protein
MNRAAIQMLQKDANGYVLLVEGSIRRLARKTLWQVRN